jgi:hypothetical protein
MDTSHSVVPNAGVTTKNVKSGDIRRTLSNSDGYFVLAAVPAGTYTVTIEAAGFAKWERTGVEFNSGDARNLAGIVLQISARTDAVTVSSQGEEISPVASGEQSAVFAADQIQSLSLLGRNTAELIRLLPGMSPTGTGVENRAGFIGETVSVGGVDVVGPLGYYSANGTSPSAIDLVSDGAHVSDPGCNCVMPVNPNPDMVQEFKVLQSNFSAENAKGPVVLLSVTKSGGKDFHGEGYLYARHFALNSNEWLLNDTSQPKPGSRFFYPGVNLGGPLMIPGTNFNKDRDKLFFFTAFEYSRQAVDEGILRAVVPTAAMREGDFTDTAYMSSLRSSQANNPPAGDAIVNGVVPKSLIDPGGQVLMNLLPMANVDPAGAGGGLNYIKALTVDRNMTQFQSRLDYSAGDNTKLYARYNLEREPVFLPTGLWGNHDTVPYPTADKGQARSDSVSMSMINVFDSSLTNEVVFGVTYLDFTFSLADPAKVSRAALGYPYQGIFKNKTDQIPNFSSWAGADTATIWNMGFEPGVFARKWLPSISDNLSKVAGAHTLKFGGYGELVTNTQPNADAAQGQISYAVWGVNSTGNAYADLLMGRVADYGETNRNTVHDVAYRTFEGYAQDNWKLTPRLSLEYGVRITHLGAWYDRSGIGFGVFDRSKYSNDPAQLGALSGLVWHRKDARVPLSGAPSRALFYAPRFGGAFDLTGSGKTVLRGGFGIFRYHDAINSVGGALDAPSGFRSTGLGFAGATLKEIDMLQPVTAKTSIIALDPTDNHQPVTYSYSFTISQRLPTAILWETSYVGNRSEDQLGGADNINLVPLGAMLANPHGNADDYRPLQNYAAVTVVQHRLYQNYNSLQTTLRKQKGRISYSVAYTFSKTMGIGAIANPFNLRDNYGPLPYDRTHMLNVSYVIRLPDLFARSTLHAVADGWQLSGISQFASSPNLASTGTNFNISGFLPDGVTPIDNILLTGTPDVRVQPIVTCNPKKGLQDNQFINPNCFALPAPGHNGPLQLPYIKGPAMVSQDLSLFKDLHFGSGKKLEFRFSAFNFLNHPVRSFSNGDPNFNLLFDAQGKLDNSRFGYADTKFGHRTVELTLKFLF